MLLEQVLGLYIYISHTHTYTYICIYMLGEQSISGRLFCTCAERLHMYLPQTNPHTRLNSIRPHGLL
jgi:hypothetical protein